MTCPILSVAGRAVACVTVVAVTRRGVASSFDALLARRKAACAEITAQMEAYSSTAQAESG